MNNTLNTTAPVAVEEKSGRRRGASLFAGTAVALSLLAGATAALFTDSEWLGTGSGGIGVGGVQRYNIEIARADGPDQATDSAGTGLSPDLVSTYSFYDTARTANSPDGSWEEADSVYAPLSIEGTTELEPGWSTTVRVLIHNDSTVATTLRFDLLDAASDTSTNLIFQNLTWSVDMAYAVVRPTGQCGNNGPCFDKPQSPVSNNAQTQHNAGDKLLLQGTDVYELAAGDYVLASVTVTFSPDFDEFVEIADDDITLNLLLRFQGTAVVPVVSG